MTTDFKAADTSIEDWIDGVSYLQADVTIYRDPALLAQYNPLIARIETLEAEHESLTAPVEDDAEDDESPMSGPNARPRAQGAAKDSSLGEKPHTDPRIDEVEKALEEAYAQAEALHARFVANAEVWTLRKMEEHEGDQIRESLGGVPQPPQPLAKNASKTMKARYAEQFDTFVSDMKKYTDEFNLQALALCTMKVVVNGEEKPAPSLDGVRKVSKRPGGVNHVRELVDALEALAAEGVSIVAPHRDRA